MPHPRFLTTTLAGTLALAGALTLPAATAHADDARRAPTCQGQKATIVGTAKNDTLRGTKKRDVIVGLGGNDTIRGMRGNDLICGGDGDDDIYGGGDNDLLRGGTGADRLYGEVGNDDLDGEEARREVTTSGGQQWVSYNGNLLSGGHGDDVLRGRPLPRSTASTVHIAAVPEILYFGGTLPVRVNLMTGTAAGHGRDKIVVAGGGEANWPTIVVGSSGNDTVHGRRTRVYPGPGRDTVTTPADSPDDPDRMDKSVSVRELTGEHLAFPIGAARTVRFQPSSWSKKPSGTDRYSGAIREASLAGGADNLRTTYPSGSVSLRNNGGAKVSLGTARAIVEVQGPGLPARIQGTQYTLSIHQRRKGRASVLDLARGRLKVSGTKGALTFLGTPFTTWWGRGSDLQLIGSARADRVEVSGPVRRLRANLGAGPDSLVVHGITQPGRSSLVGGEGHDDVTLFDAKRRQFAKFSGWERVDQ